MKRCTKCGEEKALDEFSRNSSKKDGRQPSCKVCCNGYYKANKVRRLEYQREYYKTNKARVLQRQSKHHRANKEQRSEYHRKYYESNKERLLAQHREHYHNNKDYHRDYKKERRASDPVYALSCRCRTRICDALKRKGFSKGTTTAEMLGCTWEELAAHLESQFTEGMTWDNRSDWHIDHIVPLASAETEEEILALCHYTNLQPLWAQDNLRKGAKHE